MGTACPRILWILLPLLLRGATCSGIFELKLVSFAKPDWAAGAEGGCASNCSLRLHVCLKHYQATVDPASPCTFAHVATPLLAHPHLQLPRLDAMAFDLNFSWPGQFSLVVEAWHPSDQKGVGKVLVSRFMAQRTLDVGTDWTDDHFKSGTASLDVRYRIVCPEHYYGPTCDKLCKPRDDRFGHFVCNSDGHMVCITGWHGPYCQYPRCEPDCYNGTCKEPGKCECRSGWEGQQCDQCVTHPACIHGRCIKHPYECMCDEGWGGLVCDQDLNYCTNHKPCKNGGTCTNTGQGSFTCSCTEDYMGSNCADHKNPCRDDPCQNGGVCENPSEGNFTCKCLQGYFGQKCETSATICVSNQCKNGGTCIHDPNGFICSCLPGYTGLQCEKIEPTNCQVHHCMNGGTCVESLSGFYCLCHPAFTGNKCETRLWCSPEVCENGGTCEQQKDSIECQCNIGFSGTRCQNHNNMCSSTPCANDAVCTNLLNGYRCDCKEGFAGAHCQFVDPCLVVPCLNGGTCHATDSATDFTCRCPAGFHGSKCQLEEESAANVLHRISDEEEALSGEEVALIASLSSVLILLIVLIVLVVRCLVLRKRRQECCEAPKVVDLDGEKRMNNRQCDRPQKILNELDRVPATRLTNEVPPPPPKVLNNQVSNQVMPDRGSRTFQKIDNTSGSTNSCHSPVDSISSGAIYVIEDHLRSCKDPGPFIKVEDILATEV